MKLKRIMACVLCALLFCSAASAQEGTGELIHAFRELTEHPSNVTLTGEAEFTWEGEAFKQIRANYQRVDDLNHFIDVDFRTLGRKASYDSGYTVLAQDGYADAWDKYEHAYEHSITYSERSTLLNTRPMRAVLETAETFSGLTDALLGKFISPEKTENGTVYTIDVEQGALPGVLQTAAKEAVRTLLNYYFYIYIPEAQSASGYHSLEYDYAKLFAAVYQSTYGEEMPEDFMERMTLDEEKKTDEEWDRYGTVYGKCLALIGKSQQMYENGFSVLREDGTVDHFETYGEQLRALGRCQVEYQDYYSTVEALRLQALEKGTVPADELKDKTLYEIGEFLEVGKHYMDLGVAEHAAAIYVYPDGTYKLYEDDYAFAMDAAHSVTIGIVGNMRDFQLGEVHGKIALDTEGRILSAEGSVELVVEDFNQGKHSVCMNFSGKAEDYGTTDLAEEKEAWDQLHNEEEF